jgi:aspartate racemase
LQNTFLPNEEDKNEIHRIIYDELSKVALKVSSKEMCLNAIQKWINKGAEAIVFGCREIPLIINQADVAMPIFNTTTIHATAAFEFLNQ